MTHIFRPLFLLVKNEGGKELALMGFYDSSHRGCVSTLDRKGEGNDLYLPVASIMKKFRICQDFASLQDTKLRQFYTAFLGLYFLELGGQKQHQHKNAVLIQQ